MKPLSVLAIVCSLLLVQCIKEDKQATDLSDVQVPTDTLSYTIERLSQQEANCIGDTCTEIKINFVQFDNGSNSPALEQLNQNILNGLRGEEYTNVVAYINGFMSDYEAAKVAYGNTRHWDEERNQRVVFNHPKLIGLVTNNYAFRGGAHPTYSTIFDNYDPRVGEELSWKDLMQAEQVEAMTDLGEEYFRSAFKIPTSEALEDSEYQFEKGIFYLPDNFIFNQNGITFLYPLYEIAPYVMGEQEFTIPYKDIQPMLKAEYADLIP
jgi:hypothetical protein